ncbi:8427_t:CDS:2, partial [Entrophospora sp. SA101]
NSNNEEVKENLDNLNQHLGDFLKESQPTYDPKLEKEDKVEGDDNKWSWPSTNLKELLLAPTINPNIFSSQIPKIIDPEKREIQKKKIEQISADYFDQKRMIHEASLFNCSEVHSQLQECFVNGSFFDKISLCTEARRKFWNCMSEQKKTLKKMRYKSPEKTEDENDEILYQADLQYRQKISSNKEEEEK